MFCSPKYHLLFRFLVFSILLTILCQLAAYQKASASIVISLTLEDLTLQADLIVLGRCEEVHGTWNEDRSMIFTYITLSSEKCLKSSLCPSQVKIRHLGGAVNDTNMKVVGVPSFQKGERVILFLKGSSEGYYRIIGLSQGKFSIIRRGNDVYVKRALKGLTLVEKRNGQFRIIKGADKERDVDLETFLTRIRSHLMEP